MNYENRPRIVEEIIARAEELADFFETDYKPDETLSNWYYSPWFDEFWRLPEWPYRIFTGRGRR